MDLDSLRIFRHVVEAEGFSKAVNRCGLTQSAISKQIQGLESELGQKLLDRSTHKVELTEAGALLFERSGKILADVEETRLQMQQAGGKPLPKLRIGTTSSLGISYFPGIFTNFSKRHPNCRLDIHLDFSQNLIQMIEQKELDCALICLPQKVPQSIVPLKTFSDPLTLAANETFVKKHGKNLPQKKIFALLEEEPVILISPKTYTRKIIDNYFFQHGLDIKPIMELESFDLIVSFVSLGMGLSIVPQRVFPVYARSRSISCRKLANLHLSRQLALVGHQAHTQNEMIQEFLRYFAF